MATIEANVTALEESVARSLRERAIVEIDERGITFDQLAEALEIFPDGARRLIHSPEWSVDTGIRVLSSLGVAVRVVVGEGQ